VVDKQFIALVSLLDDPDENVFMLIRKKLLESELNEINMYQNYYESLEDGVVKQRFKFILSDMLRQVTVHKLMRWRDSDKQDIAEALLHVSAFLEPGIDTYKLNEKIDALSKEIWLELNHNLTSLEKIKVVNHLLFVIHALKGKQNDEAVHLYYPSYVLQTGYGNAFALGMLYLAILQNNNLPVYGVDLPGHFLLAYTRDYWMPGWPFEESNKVLFYINPFKNGAVFTAREIEAYLEQSQLKKKETYFIPCTNEKLVVRYLKAVQQINTQLNKLDVADNIESLLKQLFLKQDV